MRWCRVVGVWEYFPWVCACADVFCICVYWGDPCCTLVSCSEGKRSALTAGHREHLRLFVYIPAGWHHLLQSQRYITTSHMTHHRQCKTHHLLFSVSEEEWILRIWYLFLSRAPTVVLVQIFELYPDGGVDGLHTETTMEQEKWLKRNSKL